MLWTVVYGRELDRQKWAGFKPFMDVINLCVGSQTRDFPNLSHALPAVFPFATSIERSRKRHAISNGK